MGYLECAKACPGKSLIRTIPVGEGEIPEKQDPLIPINMSTQEYWKVDSACLHAGHQRDLSNIEYTYADLHGDYSWTTALSTVSPIHLPCSGSRPKQVPELTRVLTFDNRPCKDHIEQLPCSSFQKLQVVLTLNKGTRNFWRPPLPPARK